MALCESPFTALVWKPNSERIQGDKRNNLFGLATLRHRVWLATLSLFQLHLSRPGRELNPIRRPRDVPTTGAIALVLA